MSDLPTGITQEEAASVADIVKNGFESNDDPNVIRGTIYNEIQDFAKSEILFNYIGTAMGYIIDTTKVKSAIDADLAGSEEGSIGFATHADFEAFVADIVSNYDGADSKLAARCVRGYCKAQKIEIPAKPAGAKRASIGKVNKFNIEHFLANPASTKQEMYEAMIPFVKTDKNAQDYTKSLHTTLFAVANKLSVEDAIAKTKDMDIVSIAVVVDTPPTQEEAPVLTPPTAAADPVEAS